MKMLKKMMSQKMKVLAQMLKPPESMKKQRSATSYTNKRESGNTLPIANLRRASGAMTSIYPQEIS